MSNKMETIEGQQPVKRTAFQGPCYFKMVVENVVAGAIIGKNGSVIASIEQQTGSALKLSPANVYYPGTMERILVISGDQDSLNNALMMILTKIHDVQAYDSSERREGFDASSAAQSNSNAKILLKIAVPKTSVAAIIGKGGQQIRELQETSGARVTVSNRSEGVVERMVTVSGTLEEARAATLSLAQCIQHDRNLREHMHIPFKVGQQTLPMGVESLNAFGHVVNFGQSFSGPTYPPQCQDILGQTCEITMQVPEAAVGAVIGRAGRHVTEIMKTTGARVRVNNKADCPPNTTDRKITISGTVSAVHNTHILILQRVQSYKDYAPSANGGHANGLGMDLPQQQQQGLLLQQNMQHFVHHSGFGC